ncbi:hypothetical protein MSAN_01942700 [Mycena sanguinolenta]|uniref:Uncharacterized protein n=1 Tax=Mycena sanguinolenta TaxID=230812 RepID=A0A8H7CNT1_9AGAR|nr:hypothetical protein MSAN_01942700 [Mycena sanguinolenta]
MLILSDLYQALNCFIHNGPLLMKPRSLATHIHLETLILQIHMDWYFERYNQPEVIARKEELWRELKMYISWVVDQGVLFGAVDRIVCRWMDDNIENVNEWEVCSKTKVDGMALWIRNALNFHWGVPSSSSLESKASRVPSN